ncbi:phage tail-collar fiber domain-containing protein, partial [Faucicola boevrei]|uniref:phage tail-collar fiber domain-containing protein n=1 Tax=Faucicola boevrei TaxID=346665 RepID=UPI00058C67D7
MSHQLFLTELGKQKLASLATKGQGNPLTITEFVVGAGINVDFSKRLGRQTLVAKKYQTTVQDVVQLSPNQYEIACIVPHDVGGFAIREIGLIADDGTLMWVGSLPEVQKPTTDSLSVVDYRINCIVSIDDANVTLSVDGNVVTATKKWVLDTVGDSVKLEIEKIREQLERQRIPIWGLLITQHHYDNSDAIVAELGYGNWIRTAQGKAIVGQNINATDWTAELGAVHQYATGNDVRQAQIFAVWQRVPDDYVPPVFRVYWTSDEQGNNQTSQINEGQKAFLWADVANLTTPQPIGGVINGDKQSSISIAGGRFDFPPTLDNGKTKLGEYAPTNIDKDLTISMGISLPNDEQVLAELSVKNDVGNDFYGDIHISLDYRVQGMGDEIWKEHSQKIGGWTTVHPIFSKTDERNLAQALEYDSNNKRYLVLKTLQKAWVADE